LTTYLDKRRFVSTLLLLAVLLIIGLMVSPFIGTRRISIARVFDFSVPLADNPDANIFFVVRLPRVLLACVAGAALACAGAVFQALLRNPLATPYILGVSTGSTLGVVIAIKLQLDMLLAGFPVTYVVAFAGAFIAISVVYWLSRSGGRLSTTTLLLAGVTVNFFFASLILLIQYLSNPAQSFQMIRWMMGGVDITRYRPILEITPVIVIALVLLMAEARNLNVLSVDATIAAQLGVNVERTRKLLFFMASLLTASVVAVCGPIGFVGLIIPHIIRLLVGADHRLLLPASVLFGAFFLIVCDTIARTALVGIEVPVGVVTAMCGGPFFIWLLMRRRIRGIIVD
jgi:iron complex transport system permease protein